MWNIALAIWLSIKEKVTKVICSLVCIVQNISYSYIYFAEDGDTVIVLLIGGDKKTQKKDIEKAKDYYNEYRKQIK